MLERPDRNDYETNGVEDTTYSFDSTLSLHGLDAPHRGGVATVQVNVGKVCNQACHHCHVEAGPKRTEVMSEATARRVMSLLERSPGVETLDLTGGAPELNPSFRSLVEHARRLGLRIVDRCNLTILFEPGMEGLADFLAANRVTLVCSLPCYTAENVDKQRGVGVFDRSIRALQQLNELGYGRTDTGLVLELVYNPVGAFLPPAQADLEARYREELRRVFSIEFNRLITITNMPIKRFAEQLASWGEHERYMSLLVNHFNPATVAGLMCRSMVSVGWNGALFDCDFNQMLELPLVQSSRALSLDGLTSFDDLAGTAIATGSHCFGCTAGAGSSCGGALAR